VIKYDLVFTEIDDKIAKCEDEEMIIYEIKFSQTLNGHTILLLEDTQL